MINTIKEKWNKIPLTVKVSTSYAICSILQKCLSFITLPLFTRLLTTEQYGQYIIYSSWQGILMIFLTLNLAYGSFQTAMVKYEERRSEYISSIQGICILLSVIFLALYLPFREIWNCIFELPTLLVLLMVSEIIFSTSTQLWMGRNRFEFKYKSVVAITLLTSILSPVLAYVLVSCTEEKGYARIIGYASINVIVGLIVFIQNTKQGKKLFNKEFWKYALGFNIPYVPFEFKRMYYISKVPEGTRRGFHAHKKRKQLLFCPYGRIQLILENKHGREEIELSDPSIGVVIEEPTWREMLWLQKDSVLCVAASDYYEVEDYIRDYEEFKRFVEEV